MINLEWHSKLKGVHWLSQQEITDDVFCFNCERVWEVWRDTLYEVLKETVKDFTEDDGRPVPIDITEESE